jgi:hypothetical protein
MYRKVSFSIHVFLDLNLRGIYALGAIAEIGDMDIITLRSLEKKVQAISGYLDIFVLHRWKECMK